MNESRENLTEAIASNRRFINAHWAWMQGDNNTNGTAEAVLATPEMQAIRRAFRSAWGSDIESAPVSLTRNLRQSGLPESVVQWVVQP